MGETKLTVRQLQAWQRRASTLSRSAYGLLSDMMDVVDVDYFEAGENFTNQADDVAAAADNLVNYLETCISNQIAGREALRKTS